MKLPESFPEGTVFVNAEGLPITAHFSRNLYFGWEDRDAEAPRPIALEDFAGKGKAITEAEWRALVHQVHTCALPALLIRAAKDLQAMRREIAAMKAQGLTDSEINERLSDRRVQLRDDEAETIALRAIQAAGQSSRQA